MKTAKKKPAKAGQAGAAKRQVKAALVPAGAPAAPAKDTRFEITIMPSKEREEAIAVLKDAKALVVTDEASHQAGLKIVKRAKAVKRSIETHWKSLKQPLNNLLGHIRDLERDELAPAIAAIDVSDKVTIAYEDAENARIAEEERVAREKREADEAEARQRAFDEAEDEALKAEESMDGLSAREHSFVVYLAEHQMLPDAAAKEAGFANPQKSAERLLQTPKILQAIEGKRTALAVRQQAAATAAAPVAVETEDFRPALGRVSGVSRRTYYGCEELSDLDALRAAWREGRVPVETFAPDMAFLGREAGRLKEQFESVYPGCVLRKKSGHAG